MVLKTCNFYNVIVSNAIIKRRDEPGWPLKLPTALPVTKPFVQH